ncbi:MAG: molybdopterin-synthase adenylyltransferase MoeB [Chloroflexi bacterium]|nr:MAG: molybdopterin-synthase adenylyltransferase MoeB [Chloroflexota bacterium]
MLLKLTQDEVLRYSRHLLMPEVGLEGQRKLKGAAVLLVGTGGLGSPLALYLAAAGVGRIGIVDYDVVDDSNLQRQVIHDTNGVGILKVESARKRMLDLNPYIQVDAYNEVFSAENAERIATGYDILVDGTDNFPTRYLINDLSVLTGRPYVYGSIFRFEGQVSVFDARRGPCYRCLFADPPPPGTVPSCAEGGVFGVLPGTVGTLQGTEVIKLILGIGEPLVGKLLLYDALDMSFQTVQLRKNPKCKVCGTNPQVTHLIDYEQFCGVPTRGSHVPEGIPEITALELAERLQRGELVRLLDVREEVEGQVSRLPGAQQIPLGQLPTRLAEIDRESEWVLYCRSGVRSARAAEILLNAGYPRVKNLRGGVNAWAKEVDPEMLVY